jgi:DNA-binding transcriptional LysR family regulator
VRSWVDVFNFALPHAPHRGLRDCINRKQDLSITPMPTPELATLRLVLRVAELGSVAAAARETGQLAATASAAVRRLEAHLGAKVFARSSRALKATVEGEAYLRRVRDALALLDLGGGELLSPLTQVRGRLRVAVSTDLGTQRLRPLLDEFMRLHPRLALEVAVGERPADLGREPVDAGIRYGMPSNHGQIVRMLVEDNEAILVAAPSYLASAGMPRTAADLAAHEAVGLRVGDRFGPRWKLIENGVTLTVQPRVRRSADNGLLARLWAIDGHGIVLKSRLDVAADLAAGRLVRVLPQVTGGPYPLVLALSPGTHLTARTRTLGDFLKARLSTPSSGQATS